MKKYKQYYTSSLFNIVNTIDYRLETTFVNVLTDEDLEVFNKIGVKQVIYNVDTFEELFELIKDLLFNNESEYTIFRLVDTYSRIFYDDLKKTNKSLIKIFKLIFNNNATNHIDISLYIIDDKKLSSFIKKWLEKKDKDDFYFNISNDVKNFLSNKYESI